MPTPSPRWVVRNRVQDAKTFLRWLDKKGATQERIAEVCEKLLKSEDDKIVFGVVQFIFTKQEAAFGTTKTSKPAEGGADPLSEMPLPELGDDG